MFVFAAGGSAVIWFATNRLGTSVYIGSVRTEWILWFKSKETLMPRQARVFEPGFPRYIVQRGHYRQPVFVQRRNFEYYLANHSGMETARSIAIN